MIVYINIMIIAWEALIWTLTLIFTYTSLAPSEVLHYLTWLVWANITSIILKIASNRLTRYTVRRNHAENDISFWDIIALSL